MPRSIGAEALKSMIGDGEELALLDVRENGEFGLGHLLFANSMPYSMLEAEIDARVPRRGARIVLADGGDGIAARAAVRLAAAGYGDVQYLEGGVDAWAKAGYVLFKGVNVPCKAFAEIVEYACGTPSISADELQSKFDAGEDLVVLDSRTEAEFNRMSIPNGINVPGAELACRVHDLAPSPETLIVVNCAGRTRSIIGAQTLINAGIANPVVALRGGTQGWVLAGRDLAHGATERYGPASPDAQAKADEIAATVRQKYGIDRIGRATLDAWRNEVGRRTLHVFDVRDSAAYEAGHLAGSVSAPGGQLVQATDRWMATRGTRVVLIDKTEIQATMTAHWLRQMGWEVYILAGGISAGDTETEAPARRVLGLDDAGMETIEAADLAAALAEESAVAIDVDLSMKYREAHIPGAVWSVRPRLGNALRAAPSGQRVVLYSQHETRARIAALDAVELHDGPVAVLRGGREAWVAAGLPLEASPGKPPDDDCIDMLFWVHDRHLGNHDSMRAYLAWEEQLPAQIAADGDANFQIPDA